jgi:hypothetical protein
MHHNYREQIPANFNDNSRIWIYQCNRHLGVIEALETGEMLNDFVTDWKSHGDPVKGYARLFFKQFIVIMADETATAVGGCSTDSSVHLIREIENRFKVELLDRQQLAFLVNDQVELVRLGDIEEAVTSGLITPETPYFNNTVLTKKEFLENLLIPVRQSWLAKRVVFTEKI